MSDSEVFIGHHCPKCKTSIATYANVGGHASCPGCGGPLQASQGGPKQKVVANFCCGGCGMKIGLLSVIGSEAKCPECGKTVE